MSLWSLWVGEWRGLYRAGWVGGTYRAVAPAEDAAVGASKGRSHFHALVGGDAVEGVFVAASSASELVLRPSGWVGGWVGRGERGGSNEVLFVWIGWVGGWVGGRLPAELDG